MCPDKKLEWFDPDQAAVVDQLVRQRWSDTYKSSPHAEVSSQPDGSPVKVCYPNLLYPYGPEKKFRRARNGLLIDGAMLNNHPDIRLTLSTPTSRNL